MSLPLLLTACAPDPPPELQFGAEPTCWNEPRSEVAPNPVELAADVCPPPADWTATPDSEHIVAIEIVPDVTRDGRSDAIVTYAAAGISGGEEMRAERVIPSPLAGMSDTTAIAELRFPADAAGIVLARDLDGDSRADLLVEHASPCRTTLHAVFSPFEEVVPYWEGPLYDGSPIDVDGSGAWEQQRYTDGAVEIRASGIAAWSAEPCLVVAPSCQSPGPIGADVLTTAPPWSDLARAWPDLDGNGERELWLGGAGGSCGGFVFSAALTGAYDPHGDRHAAQDIDPLTVFADQSGDGLADVTAAGEVLFGPLTFDDGEVLGTERRVPAIEATPLEIDLDGDGFAEWAAPEVDGAIDVFTGGPTGGVWSGQRRWRVWVNAALDVAWFVEDGVAYVLLVQADGALKTLEVGPGSVIALR